MYLKQCEVVTRVEFIQGDLQEILKSKKTIKKWAYIVHDKDDTAPHYDIYLNFGNSGVDTKQVADWFGLQESQVSKIRGRSTDMLLYLTHGNDSQKHKHQYDVSEVIANFDFETEISNAKILGDFKNYSYAQQLAYVDSLPISEKPTAFRKLNTLWELWCKNSVLQNDRNIDVMFICGRAGAGKTYYAKKLLNSMGLDYCVSSSSNDCFQDYMGQKAIILDDLRDTAYEFEDLLKILDNNTASTVKSRFNNKVFNGSLIVITSAVPLRYWYKLKLGSSFDTLTQLYRRIGCYVEVTKDEITVFDDGVGDDGKPLGLGQVFKNELSTPNIVKPKKRNFTELFSKICDNADLGVLHKPYTQLEIK